MSNREQREHKKSLHLYLAMRRPSVSGEKSGCIRSVIKRPDEDLEVLKYKLKIVGGHWRIHRTVNARDVEKARKWLLKKLIDHPEKGAYVDSEWRTALLQPGCIYGDKRFMLDVDRKDKNLIENVEYYIGDNFIEKHESPKGWHYITKPFDTRDVLELEDVTLIRDGYYYVCTVEGAK